MGLKMTKSWSSAHGAMGSGSSSGYWRCVCRRSCGSPSLLYEVLPPLAQKLQSCHGLKPPKLWTKHHPLSMQYRVLKPVPCARNCTNIATLLYILKSWLCVCACVRERQREGEREKGEEGKKEGGREKDFLCSMWWPQSLCTFFLYKLITLETCHSNEKLTNAPSGKFNLRSRSCKQQSMAMNMINTKLLYTYLKHDFS